MHFSLYKRLCLDNLVPTDISLQMADKSTAVPIGISEDVLVEVANCLILTDFVVLDMPEDGSMSIIHGRPFLNTASAIIDCIKESLLSMLMTRNTRYIFRRRLVKGMALILLRMLRP